MPKELVHFKVAEMTAAALADTRFDSCLKGRPQGLLLGAVFHDALYYGEIGAGRDMREVAHALHGMRGQDTYGLLRIQARHAATAPDRDLAAALLVGMTSHLCADAAMHPMVWHFTGDYYASEPQEQSLARQRHRALESLMDMVACPEMIGRPKYLLRTHLSNLGDALFTALPMRELAGMGDLTPGRAEAALGSAFSLFALFQRLFPVRPLARLLFGVYPLLPAAAREVAALFYAPRLMDQAERLSGSIEFQDPVTGAPVNASLHEMMTCAATRAAELCRALEPAVFDRADPDLPAPGPSLDSGRPGTGPERMRNLADPPFPKLP